MKHIDILRKALTVKDTITIIAYIINAYYNVGGFKINAIGKRLCIKNLETYGSNSIINDFLIYSTTPNEEFCRMCNKKVKSYIAVHDISIQEQTISDIIQDFSDYYYNNAADYKFLQG